MRFIIIERRSAQPTTAQTPDQASEPQWYSGTSSRVCQFERAHHFCQKSLYFPVHNSDISIRQCISINQHRSAFPDPSNRATRAVARSKPIASARSVTFSAHIAVLVARVRIARETSEIHSQPQLAGSDNIISEYHENRRAT
eukprot:66965_1